MTIDRLDLLQLDVDMRLREQWQLVFDVGDAEFDRELVGALMRSAYARGYVDALTEDPPAQLHRDHGYRTPTPKRRG